MGKSSPVGGSVDIGPKATRPMMLKSCSSEKGLVSELDMPRQAMLGPDEALSDQGVYTIISQTVPQL
jgi:hypothetical protein